MTIQDIVIATIKDLLPLRYNTISTKEFGRRLGERLDRRTTAARAPTGAPGPRLTRTGDGDHVHIVRTTTRYVHGIATSTQIETSYDGVTWTREESEEHHPERERRRTLPTLESFKPAGVA